MKKIYIVEAVSYSSAINTRHISQEAYSTLEAAQDFCRSRIDEPCRLSDFKFMSDDNTYNIYELILKEE